MLPNNSDNPVTSKTKAAFGELFARHDCFMAEMAILQAADPFLETAGEDLRRRMFTTTGPAGEELCLRPDFTIPVCIYHLQSKTDLPCRYGYLGPVFRQRDDGPGEFLQMGVEHLGRTEKPQIEDGDVMAIAVEACQTSISSSDLLLKLGDPSLFYGLLASLGVPDALKHRLIRAFSRGLNATILEHILRQGDADILPLPDQLVPNYGSKADLAAGVGQMMRDQGLSIYSGRSPEAIAERYIETYGPQDYGLSGDEKDRIQTVLSAYLCLECPAQDVGANLSAFEAEYNVSFGAKLVAYTERLSHFESKSGARVPARFVFSSGFARPLDYYTGFVFELYRKDVSRPIAGGGRYDKLMEILGADVSVPAVGFSLWLDRLPSWSDAQ
ncbi:MAG: ATP phosphoribosyltransferase regulatory subunit [Hyphomicrobiales bacterium]|uniref:ATP phosphoribosyltransferase regulatory subunit n=1 Tax=Roseibium sp. TaxID=1936156 RepID=UPI0032831E71